MGTGVRAFHVMSRRRSLAVMSRRRSLAAEGRRRSLAAEGREDWSAEPKGLTPPAGSKGTGRPTLVCQR